MGLGASQMEKYTKLILGLVCLTAGILAVIKWKDALWTLVSGGVGLFLIVIGSIILLVSRE